MSGDRGHKSGLIAAWIVLLLIDGLATLGLMRLEFGHGLDRLFQSDTARYQDYAAFAEEFGETIELLIRVEGEDLAAPESLAALETFLIELQLAGETWTVLSPLSIPVPDDQGAAVTLDRLRGPTAGAWARAFDTQPLLSRFLREDRKAALVTVLGVADTSDLDVIRSLATQHLADGELDFGISGLPVILDRSRALLVQDFLVLNGAGAILGTAVAVLAMGSFWLALITLLSAGTAVLWAMGVMGWMGIEINVISIALPVLVLALAFSDAVHVGLDQRALTKDGMASPVWPALRRIGPAALLTSLTTAIAFASLGVSGSAVLAGVGAGGALAMIVACFGVLAANGLVGATLLRVLTPDRIYLPQHRMTSRLFDWQILPRIGLAAPRAVSIAAIGVAAIAACLYLTASPRFSFDENLRENDPARAVLEQIERDFGAMAAIQIPVEAGSGEPVDMARSIIAALPQPLAENAVSLAAMADAAAAAGLSLDELMRSMAPWVQNALIGGANGRFLVSVLFDDTGARDTRVLSRAIEQRLDEALLPDLADQVGRVTGPYVMSAFVSETMIRALSVSLLLSIAASGLIIAIWLRSAKLGLLALVPNVLPVALAGAGMGVSGHGLSFAAGIALTLAFGISVDDTIHVLNRLRLASNGLRPACLHIRPVMQQVTPALVITTLVLTAGLSSTLAATLPTVVVFGMLAITVLFLALISDLLILPAMIQRFHL
ncbi:efflux RND transporter permease subunit [Aquicoccus porphyridii]|uniref:MMPL family transporter n=1 Tax=Aquicoccus porphyridii TaxID=1852029 RepID=A0A5A9Z5A7_9RHOB|nr:MMPL family transporter [Aquicoccus porphyridii]KAA0912370.1 MMPL family transporter [Aquicoccus porphyridii]RAI54138.1 hypothetical protein DOO74_07745 [Rhodobacteraceae bacterium AsT-22]